MKTLKVGLMSFFAGIVLSIVPISIYAACDATITFRDANNCHITYTCHLVGETDCSNNVCVCAYTCDGCGHWDDCDFEPDSGGVH
jgi:hypothetical protein